MDKFALTKLPSFSITEKQSYFRKGLSNITPRRTWDGNTRMRNTKPGSWQNVVGLKATIGMVYVLNFLLLRRHTPYS